MNHTAIFFMVLVTYSNLAYSEWNDTVKKGWEATKEYSEKNWDKSKEYTSDVWNSTRNAWNSSNTTFSESEETRKQSRADQEDERFRNMWSNVFSQLEEGLSVVNEIKVAPDSTFFGDDKKSLRDDLNIILDKTIILLEDETINDYRIKIDNLKQRIKVSKNNISGFREKKITAPRNHMVKTTKQSFDKKIAEEKLNITDYEADINKIKIHFKERLNDIGVALTEEQINILLARVDANDIIQMSVIFDILKKITVQLMELTQDSNEEIKQAKKYYGMHVVLLELVNYMQQKYIYMVENNYIPKIDAIIEKIIVIQNEARKNIQEDGSEKRIAIYKNNLAAQELTLKTAKLYKKNLREQQNKVASAQKVVQKDLKLSQNTYDTVEVSADLLSVLKTSKDSFDALMGLQVPQIIPFENIKMQDKYQELSNLIKQ
ncbi:MAG: hypothetical protein KZQ83_15205 [gamma proteobacterium symbiont of Taylorina sp.]|nr:hypothetical protein [gamma proteobacterium symbiont of Taylorina sp.]